MYLPSLSTILGVAFLGYIGHSMWTVAQLFTKLKCTDVPCYYSFLATKPRMQLALFISTTPNPISSEVTSLESLSSFDYWHEFNRKYEIKLPAATRRNGSLYMQVVLAAEGQPLEWKTLKRDGPTIIHSTRITDYMEPQAETFNLLGENGKQSIAAKPARKKNTYNKPVTHIMSDVYVVLLTDDISLSSKDVPPEMAKYIHVNQYRQILPIMKTDFFNTRPKDLVKVSTNMTSFTINYHYQPIGTGKLRFMLLFEHSIAMMQNMGIPKKDIDEVKSMLSGTNLYLLLVTVFVASVHLLFDFLSFKNDIIFWRKKKSYEGLSTRTTLWRAFSQIVIFFYLMDEKTSLLVLVPVGLGVFIELWKCKKILKLEFYNGGLRRRSSAAGQNPSKSLGAAEQKTEEFDKQGMLYLSYLLYPLCIAGAVYSLLYKSHRSWYSWTLNSLVNGVYAFGFLFMLPQLFVNYKLKSVAALPWRSFMYKAFNTFIDDFFAIIITMPTAHRVACLRDDIVFLIYLYQRWLYPVDKNRVDSGLSITESIDDTETERVENIETDTDMEKKTK